MNRKGNKMYRKLIAAGAFVFVAFVALNLSWQRGITPVYASYNGGSLPTGSLGYQQYTSLGSSTNLSNVPAGAWYVMITVEGAAIRWRDDGTAPTASVGMPVSAGSSFFYTGSISKFAVIQQTSGATINISYYR